MEIVILSHFLFNGTVSRLYIHFHMGTEPGDLMEVQVKFTFKNNAEAETGAEYSFYALRQVSYLKPENVLADATDARKVSAAIDIVKGSSTRVNKAYLKRHDRPRTPRIYETPHLVGDPAGGRTLPVYPRSVRRWLSGERCVRPIVAARSEALKKC